MDEALQRSLPIMLKNCFTIRPGSIIGIKGEAYKVTANYTIDQILEMRQIDSPHLRKTLHYSPGQEISVRWVPDNRI
jgi:hypothetical protein